MKESHREWTFRYLNDNERYGWLDERCTRIAEGRPFSHCWRDYCLSGSAFKEWIAEKPERQGKIYEAFQKKAELRLQQKRQDRVDTVRRRETLKLYFAMHGASQEAWQRAGRLLKVDLPPRPGDRAEV